MKLTNNIVHAVVGDNFVVGLHALANDGTTVKCMVTKDKRKCVNFIIYLPQRKIIDVKVIMCWLIFLKLRNIMLTLQGRFILNGIGISCIQSLIVQLSIVL